MSSLLKISGREPPWPATVLSVILFIAAMIYGVKNNISDRVCRDCCFIDAVRNNHVGIVEYGVVFVFQNFKHIYCTTKQSVVFNYQGSK